MKIVFVIGAYSFGGAERVMTNLVNYFSAQNDVTYIALQNRETPAYEINKNVHMINGLNYANTFDCWKKLRKEIKKSEPDIVIAFLTQVNLIAIASCIGTHIPVIISERNDPTKRITRIRRIFRTILYPLANGVVFQTEDAKVYYSKKIQDMSVIIPNPVFITDSLKNYISQKRNNEIVAAGRLEDQKNYPMLIEAFAKIADEFPDYIVKIYGEGRKRESIERLIEAKGLNNRVLLCGQCSDLHERVKDSYLYVMTSDYEGMPNALMEAMALGICSISTDCPVGGPRVFIRNNENGFLIKCGNVEQLATLFRQLLTHESQVDRIARNGKEILNDVSLPIIAQKWMQFMLQIVDGKKYDRK